MTDRESCWKCGRDWEESPDNEGCCAECGADAHDEPTEPDPDDARDVRRDEPEFYR